MKRILFYYHHFGGLGHGTRIYSVCKAIRRIHPDYKILVINSGVPQPELNIKRYATIINLPYFKAEKGLFSGLYSPEGIDATFKKRRRMLGLIVERFNPHIAVFEHFPFGRGSLEKELIYLVNELGKRNILIYASVRDIVVQKISVDKLNKRLKFIRGIFVHSDRETGFVTNFRKSELLNKKIIFTGRTFPLDKEELIDKKKIRKGLKCGSKKLIVVSIGGGIDGIDIVDKMLQIKEKIDRKFSTFYLISTGPSISGSEFKRLKNITKNRSDILVKKFVPQYPSYVNAADLYISMGGYNSINNALFTGTKTIILPRQSDDEQKLRTTIFSKFLVVCQSNISSEKLAGKVTEVLKRREPPFRYKGELSGAHVTANLIDRILNFSYIKVRLTTKCNLNCRMCSVRHQKHELDFARLKEILSHAGLLNVRVINFTGGEPVIHPQFHKLVHHVKREGFYLSISTNANFTNKDARYLSQFVDFMDISINSHREYLDDKIRGKRGAFRNTINSIKRLNRLNKNVKLHINVTVRPDNFQDIHQIVPLLARYIDSISFTLVDTSINKLEYLKFKKNQLELFYFTEVPLILKECMRRDIALRITPFFRELQKLDLSKQFKRLQENKKYYRSRFKSVFEIKPSNGCLKRATQELRINSNGEVCPCCYLDDYPVNLGNIYNRDLFSIVSSPKYIDFILSAKPDRGWCKKCALGYRIYAKLFK